MPMPSSWPDGGTIGASMAVRLFGGSKSSSGASIVYTTNGDEPTAASKHYTTELYLGEDGQACHQAAEADVAARGAPDGCDVSLRATTLPPADAACMLPSESLNMTFHVLSA